MNTVGRLVQRLIHVRADFARLQALVTHHQHGLDPMVAAIITNIVMVAGRGSAYREALQTQYLVGTLNDLCTP